MHIRRCCLMALVLINISAFGQVPRTMGDPLFGIQYKVGQAAFERLPQSVLNACRELQTRYEGAWVYGHVTSADTEYYIVSGLMHDYDEGTGRKTGTLSPDETGLIVAIRGSKCSMEAQDSFYWNARSPEWSLPDSVLAAFAKDALERYSKAFGGKDRFLKRLDAGNDITESFAPVLQKQLKLFRNQP
jgi:hypothetical protein